MFQFKTSRSSGYSIVYALIVGGLCVILVLAIYKIEIQRKKYMIDFQRSVLKSEKSNFNINLLNRR